MPIRMTGLTSGLDTESIVNQLMSAQRTKQTKVENKKQKLEWKQEIWKGLNTKIYGFYKDSLSKMKYSSNYSTKKASVSDSTKLTATASTKAAAGSYKVEIKSIASVQYVTSGKLSYKELENLPVMCLEGSTSTRKYVEDYLAERGTFVRPEFELATSDMLIQFAVRNLGVASVVSDFAEKYIESGELFVLKFDRAIPEREFCIVSNERAPMSAAAEKLYDFLLVP